MSEEVDRNDPELKYLSVERNQFNDPATQAEWTQKRLVWVPHENQVSAARISILAEQPFGVMQTAAVNQHCSYYIPHAFHTQRHTHTQREVFFSFVYVLAFVAFAPCTLRLSPGCAEVAVVVDLKNL